MHTRGFARRRARALGTGLAAALALVAASGPEARAGTYQVQACVNGGLNRAWVASGTPSRGFTNDACVPSGDKALHATVSFLGTAARGPAAVGRLAAAPADANATWTFTAPAGTSVSALSAAIRCDYPSPFSSTPKPAGCNRTTFLTVVNEQSSGTPSVRISVSCSGSTCTGKTGSIDAREIVTTVRDDIVPTVAVTGGSLTTAGVKTGAHTVSFDASDGSGIQAARLYVDGGLVVSRAQACDFLKPAPCPTLSGSSFTYETQRLANGTHQFEVEVVDAAGNLRRSPARTFQTANAYPAPGSGSGPTRNPTGDFEDLPEEGGADPVPGATCDPDTELGADDFCPQTEEPNGPGDEFSLDPPGVLAAEDPLAPGGRGWGLSDQRPEVFGPDYAGVFASLAPKRVRYIAHWDQVTRGLEVEGKTDVDSVEDFNRLMQLDRYVNEANARGLEVLLSFTQARERTLTGASEAFQLPSLAEYKKALNTTLDRYRTIRHFTAWNEPNELGQPTSSAGPAGVNGPKRAAQYWKLVKRTCKTRGRSCWVGAGDFLDDGGLFRTAGINQGTSYFRRYLNGLKKATPNYWALHPYNAGVEQSGRRKAFDSFMRRTGDYSKNSRVWLTEYGQEVPKYADDNGGPTAKKNLRLALALPAGKERIRRFYYYTLYRDPGFDTSLTASPSSLRCLFFIYRYKSNPGSSSPPVPANCPRSAAP